MQGEFKGDFTRDTHHPLKRFSRVLMQQGRVLLDADWNEQTSIVLHYLRSLAADLIGPYGGAGDGFKIEGITVNDSGKSKEDFTIEQGHYYVQGILCENDAKIANHQHRGISFTDFQPLAAGTYLVYLDVWERHITFLADEDPRRNDPSIREVALGGPDTASRAQVVWQVRWVKPEVTIDEAKKEITAAQLKNKAEGDGFFRDILKENSIIPEVPGRLRARAIKPKAGDHDCACVTSPESRYRGVENQLYRVEVHKPGVAWNGVAPLGIPDRDNPPSTTDPRTGPLLGRSNLADAATFKWSRENASVVFRIRKPVDSGDGTTTVALSDLGRDARFGLKKGDWVELVDDDYILQNRAEPLLEVQEINADQRSVILSGKPGDNVGRDLDKHPMLRRWEFRGDPRDGGLTSIQVGAGEKNWLPLEDGIEIQFQAPAATTFNTGDYWLIPARVATGDVEWPGPPGDPAPLLPHGIEHHYAPLAHMAIDSAGKITGPLTDLRRTLTPLAQ
jgi:hypothetical protein